MTHRSHGLELWLFGELREMIEAFCGKVHLGVPPHQSVNYRSIAVFFVINDHIDNARTNAQCSAERTMAGVTLPCMLEHIIG